MLPLIKVCLAGPVYYATHVLGVHSTAPCRTVHARGCIWIQTLAGGNEKAWPMTPGSDLEPCANLQHGPLRTTHTVVCSLLAFKRDALLSASTTNHANAHSALASKHDKFALSSNTQHLLNSTLLLSLLPVSQCHVGVPVAQKSATALCMQAQQ